MSKCVCLQSRRPRAISKGQQSNYLRSHLRVGLDAGSFVGQSEDSAFFLMYWSIFSKNVSKSSPDDMPKRPAVHSCVHPVSSTERRNACKLAGCLSSLPPSFKSIKSRKRTFQSLNSAMVKLSGFDRVGATTFLTMLPVLDADLMLVCVACAAAAAAAAAAAELRCSWSCWVTIRSINCCCC